MCVGLKVGSVCTGVGVRVRWARECVRLRSRGIWNCAGVDSRHFHSTQDTRMIFRVEGSRFGFIPCSPSFASQIPNRTATILVSKASEQSLLHTLQRNGYKITNSHTTSSKTDVDGSTHSHCRQLIDLDTPHRFGEATNSCTASCKRRHVMNAIQCHIFKITNEAPTSCRHRGGEAQSMACDTVILPLSYPTSCQHAGGTTQPHALNRMNLPEAAEFDKLPP